MRPVTRYATSGDIKIAYQVVGDGPIDLIFVLGWISHIECGWEDPALAEFRRRLASFSRLILFDKRGTGLSDRVPVDQLPTLEQRMDDVRAVMDAVGSKRAALMGISEGGPMCALFAATYPERTEALIVIGGYARRLWAPDYPWGMTAEEHEAWLAESERGWGGPVGLASRAPSLVNDERYREWWATYLRMSASPSAAVAFTRMNGQIDIRPVLSSIRVPTLILHATGDTAVRIGQGRDLAARIPGARFVELLGADHLPWVSHADQVLEEVQEFLTGTRQPTEPDRVLATVLFTDIVGSTERATKLGDSAWKHLLQSHHAIVRRELERFRGREVKTTGDGFLATFDGPARAIRCACALVEDMRRLGIEIRAGPPRWRVRDPGSGYRRDRHPHRVPCRREGEAR